MKGFDEQAAIRAAAQAEELMMSTMPYIPPDLSFEAIQDAYDGVRESLERLRSTISARSAGT